MGAAVCVHELLSRPRPAGPAGGLVAWLCRAACGRSSGPGREHRLAPGPPALPGRGTLIEYEVMIANILDHRQNPPEPAALQHIVFDTAARQSFDRLARLA